MPSKWKNFDGMILAGWSRYDHFLSLCELLPYSIPSMLFSISAWQQQFSSLPNINVNPNKISDYVQKELGCSSALHLNTQDHLTKPIPKFVELYQIISFYRLIYSFSDVNFPVLIFMNQ
jgi:hypothetical protein